MKLVIKEKEYEIKPMSVGDYLDLNEQDVIKMTDLEVLERFTTAPKESLIKIPYAKVKFIASMIRSSYGSDTDALPLALTLKINDTYYGLIRPSELSYEEWINLEVFMAEKPLDILKLATHLYKPLKSDKMGEDRELVDYDMGECKTREQEFRDMNMGNLTSALFFLTTFVEKLTESLLGSLEKKMKGNTKNPIQK